MAQLVQGVERAVSLVQEVLAASSKSWVALVPKVLCEADQAVVVPIELLLSVFEG